MERETHISAGGVLGILYKRHDLIRPRREVSTSPSFAGEGIRGSDMLSNLSKATHGSGWYWLPLRLQNTQTLPPQYTSHLLGTL